MRQILWASICLVLVACGGSEPHPVQAEATAPVVATADTSRQIKPETIVTFPKGQVACLSEETLQAVLTAGLDGKETKMNSPFETGECMMLPPAKAFKVIDAHYRDPALPEAGVLEVVGVDVKAAEHGAYVLVMDASFVQQEPAD